MNLVHLLASPFVGGPERQVLGLARAQSADHRTTFLSFAERGLARPFLERARADGFAAHELTTNFPHVGRAIAEVADWLRRLRADVLLTSGYKPDLIGWRAARTAGVPVVGIAHGWTGVTWKVRLYEWLDTVALGWMDAVVCVSEAMARRARGRGVPARKLAVIRNALDATPYDRPRPEARPRVEALFTADTVGSAAMHRRSEFGLDHAGSLTAEKKESGDASPHSKRPALIVGAAGRLSPEKGFDVFIRAAAVVAKQWPDVGFVVFGDGPARPVLEELIRRENLVGRFVLAGFQSELEMLLPGLDVAVLSSHTEGLPVAVLEAQAAGLPVVATAVGGTPEVVLDGTTGLLVPPARPDLLAARISELLADAAIRRRLGEAGRQRAREEFTFRAQAEQYERLFARLVRRRPAIREAVHVHA